MCSHELNLLANGVCLAVKSTVGGKERRRDQDESYFLWHERIYSGT